VGVRDLVIAGNYEQARFYAREQGLHPDEWCYVRELQDLFGRQDIQVYVVGTAFEHRWYPDAIDYLKTKNIKIIYV